MKELVLASDYGTFRKIDMKVRLRYMKDELLDKLPSVGFILSNASKFVGYLAYNALTAPFRFVKRACTRFMLLTSEQKNKFFKYCQIPNAIALVGSVTGSVMGGFFSPTIVSAGLALLTTTGLYVITMNKGKKDKMQKTIAYWANKFSTRVDKVVHVDEDYDVEEISVEIDEDEDFNVEDIAQEIAEFENFEEEVIEALEEEEEEEEEEFLTISPPKHLSDGSFPSKKADGINGPIPTTLYL